MRKVHVTAWRFDSGGGFNWYFTPESADKAFEEEKANCDHFSKDNWTAYRFDVEVPALANPDEVTRQIDDQIDDLMDAATIKFPE